MTFSLVRFSVRRRTVAVALMAVTPPLLFGLIGPRAAARESDEEQDRVVAVIEKLGGKVERDEASPDRPVVRVGLVRTKGTDAALAHLKRLTTLREVDLDSSDVTDAGLAHLSGLNRLRVLKLVGTRVTDAGLERLKELKGLRSLRLIDTEVTDAGLVHLKGMVDLRMLSLPGATDAGLASLEGLTSLESLHISGRRGTDAGLAHLKKLVNLRGLTLRATRVTAGGISDLRRTLPQLKVNLDPGFQ